MQAFADTYKLGFSGQSTVGGTYDQAKAQGYDGNDRGEAAQWLAAKAKGLDMSVQARQLRAVDAGFLTTDQWQGVQDGVQRGSLDKEGRQDGRGDPRPGDGDPGRLHAPGQLARFYHGTKDDVANFDPSHPNRKDAGWLGRGTYVTSNPDHAELYSGQKRGEGSPRVMPLAIRLQNPYVADDQFKQKMSRMSPAGVLKITNDLKAAGYDGVVLSLDSETTEVVVFDPAGVRSENAAFDPDHKDSTNILSQFAGATAQTADVHALETAERRLKNGVRPEIVRRDTGWFRGVDAKMRFEISDKE